MTDIYIYLPYSMEKKQYSTVQTVSNVVMILYITINHQPKTSSKSYNSFMPSHQIIEPTKK